ncbi:hypothetical protein V5E97_05080 [Singulisphaera sp. Ch08]|uniref:Carboxypeptidase regulatory-like domain-containing protein n=1 Tax=Singulisphaera sp. Ch08 TaxID=3120278 RepID=A0AAU7CIP9_9BACT
MKRVITKPGARHQVCLLVMACVPLAPLACGTTGPGMAPVSGRVTYQSKPVPKGSVTFAAISPTGRNATGQLDENGNYTLQTENPGDGALLGEYNVTIYAHDEPILDYIPKKKIPPKILSPTKYEKPETSGLKATVKSGSNKFDFDLTD